MREWKEFVLYRIGADAVVRDFICLFSKMREGGEPDKELQTLCVQALHRLLEQSARHGFCGNLWHAYLTFLIVNDENAYSLACEMRESTTGSIHVFALHDFAVLQQLFALDFAALSRWLGQPLLLQLTDYQRTEGNGGVFNRRIRDRIVALSARLGQAVSAEELKQAVTDFYQTCGVGSLGLHKAFRIAHYADDVKIEPISNIAHVHLDDLVGYELAKQKLVENTEAFVLGRSANNCLLYGDAGTGKSTSIKAIINQYYERGLRMIEVYKHQFQDLHALIAQIKNRNYRFIIYMDDLSFEDFEIEYKYLKAVIEGGLEKKPDNILIYATSNRRHLVREKFSDKEERLDDLHKNDTVQEKLSLVGRFGETIYYGAPTPKEFKEIVLRLADKAGILLPKDQLLAKANQWELSHGGLSGRTAQQFINHLLGRSEDETLRSSRGN